MGVAGKVVAVTGASGFVGHRLVEMLVERGAAKVVALDISPWPANDGVPADSRIDFRFCNLSDIDGLNDAFRGVECVWHMAALVGPFHPAHLYMEVNYHGTLNVIEACKLNGVPKLVNSSTPSTRFRGTDISGLTEDQLPRLKPGEFLEPYAETKSMAEDAVAEACCNSLLTVSIAPHQVYGPKDPIFFPNLMDSVRTGKLRIFGSGQNRISVVYNDNYCHGLILGEEALAPGADCLGKFYIITDDVNVKIWDILEDAGQKMGYPSLHSRASLPVWLLMLVAHCGRLVGKLTGRSFKLTPFVVKMMTIDRWFNIDAAKKDLGYEPLYDFESSWAKTVQWFIDNPDFMRGQAKMTDKKAKDV